MNIVTFVGRQVIQIQQGGWETLSRKIKVALRMLLKLPLYTVSVPVVIVFRLIRPWFLVRWGGLSSSRIGHFCANTEMYLCERDAGINIPQQNYVDLFHIPSGSICNQQLAIMWKRVLRVWPSWVLAPINRVNSLIPGGAIHEVGNNTQSDRDVLNLLERFPPHLEFTPEEKNRGKAGLRAMGIPEGSPFVCLLVRDSAYLAQHIFRNDWDYHNYRDSSIQNYVLAAEELAERGYYVIRMGAKVAKAMKTSNSRIVDYAVNGMRSDFMDIFLGSKCAFCISTGAGWDAVPAHGFRRPVVYTNLLPIGYLPTFLNRCIFTTKRHILSAEKWELTLREIFNRGVGFFLHTSDYESKGIKLIENTPEEIRDVVVEMDERLKGTWQPQNDDEVLQRRFWEIFPTDAVTASRGRPLHGEIRARFGAHFLRNNRDWLQ